MTILFESRSFDGNVRVNEIICSHFYAKDNVRIKNGPEQDLIICKLVQKGTVTIAFFGSTKQRDLALEALKKANSSVVMLDYNKYFVYEPWDDEWAHKLCAQYFGNFSLQKTVSFQLENHITEPHNTDAFKILEPLFIDAMTENRSYFIQESDQYSRLWAKCLWTPSIVINRGISPRQYYLYLINKNNEKFTNNL